MSSDIPIHLLRRVFDYDRVEGLLYWVERTPDLFKGSRPAHSCTVWNTRYAGKEAFTTVDSNGYRVGCLFGPRPQKAHRVIWALHYGEWPKIGIDHLDNNRQNNRIDNLVLATQRDNMNNKFNSRLWTTYHHQGTGKIQVRTSITESHLFDTLEEAKRFIAHNRLSAK